MSPLEAEGLAYSLMLQNGLSPEKAEKKINEIKSQPGFEESKEYRRATPRSKSSTSGK
jgi:hypothetical protein